MTRPRCDRVSLGRRGRVVYWGYWTCRVGGTSPRRCVGVYSSGSLRRYSAARGQRADTPRLGARGQILRARGQRADTPLSLIGESLSSVRSSAIPKLGPLLRTLTRYSECGQPRPRAEQAAHVRSRGLACEHSMTPWPPRPRHEEAGTNALISLSVMPISMSSKTQVRRVALVKSFVEEDEPSAVLMM